MTSLLARILLSIMLLPLAVVVYLAVLLPLTRGNDEVAFTAATSVTAVFVAIYWLMLWRRSVQWTLSRVSLTIAGSVGCLFAGVIAGLAAMGVSGIRDEAFGVFIGGLVGAVLWLPVTILVWRERPAERAERIRQSASDVLFCPRCGYNMTGLQLARCPECGAQFTLNELFAAQRHQHEIADAASSAEERPGRASV
ncbi:MAG: zinc ribbon domain-containing protein [Phycisphaerae bacterium]|jgi:hypothetical protein|nr:zinc ribbon domain-containing protein [Phycisphaerae bacterium]